MNTKMKMALVNGLVAGFGFALLVILARVFISEIPFTEVVTSMYGILTLIFAPIVWVFYFIADAKKGTE